MPRAYGVAAGLPSPPWRTTEEGDGPSTSSGRSRGSSRRTKPSISFEFFPPKDDESEAALWLAIRQLERVHPAFVSVTYGAGGTTQDRTVRVTERIADETSLTPLAHLTCVGPPCASCARWSGQYAAAGVRNILALRGDPPGNVARPVGRRTPRGSTTPTSWSRWSARSATSPSASRPSPTCTPTAPASTTTSRCWCARRDAGASFAITQMVFDADNYLRLRDRRRGAARRCRSPRA